MGFAKYHEDDLKIYDERMYYRNASSSINVQPSYSKVSPRIVYSFYCPFCKKGFVSLKKLIKHITSVHGGIHEFVYLNDRRVERKEKTVKRIISLVLYCFHEEAKEIQVKVEQDNYYSFWTKPGVFEYDIQAFLQSKLYSEIYICNIDAPVHIKQQLDISRVSIKKILSGKYQSYLFDEQISEELLSPKECLTYLKMLINEEADIVPFIERIGYMNLDESREVEELYYYYFLSTGATTGIQDKISGDIAGALLALLDGKYEDAEKWLRNAQGNRNDIIGCRVILDLLKNDKLGADYLEKRYTPIGIIGVLEQVLRYYSEYEEEPTSFLTSELNELELFIHYPLIRAIMELNEAINYHTELSSYSYTLLRELTPIAAIYYCRSIDDEKIKEKIIKSMMKTHKKSKLIKEYAYSKDYSWVKNRITVSDGTLYEKAVYEINREHGRVFSDNFIEAFPFDDRISITSLGGEKEIGASCFVISYKGFNIMLDCGINVRCLGDEAYPLLDKWENDIDIIIITHAHIDHSGGVPKAHAMWPDAKIISTAPTKALLKYLYSDMAKVKNGIVDDFEIDNITIEKDVMLDTLNSMTTIGFEEWLCLGKDIDIRLHRAGHIIGAAMVELRINEKTILYTGDFCNYSQALVRKSDLSTLPRDIDYLISESTYLKKPKIDWDSQCNEIKKSIMLGINAHHAILLPAASIGRSQELVCIIGEMKLSGEIPNDIPLYIAGMAIPAVTQIIPFMNERYESIVGMFEEFNGSVFPETDAIVIASSGSMSKGSASYKIARYWDNQCVKYNIIANGYLDEETEIVSRYQSRHCNIQHVSLPAHADLEGVIELIEYVSPKVLSFVHRGSESESDIQSLINNCKSKFSNDILYKDLKANQIDKVFDIYEWLLEGETIDE